METKDSYPTAPELFNQGLESFTRGEIAQAVARLRAGLFENLYIAPILMKEDFQAQAIWYPGPQAEPKSAAEYATRYRRLWDETANSLDFLRSIWVDPLVRSELKAYVNLCKSLLNARAGRQQLDLLKERDRFLNPERIKRTQMEILQRIENAEYRTPAERPHLPLVMLASSDPAPRSGFTGISSGSSPSRQARLPEATRSSSSTGSTWPSTAPAPWGTMTRTGSDLLPDASAGGRFSCSGSWSSTDITKMRCVAKSGSWIAIWPAAAAGFSW